MKKKNSIIYALVGVVVVGGIVVSRFVDWSVDGENASGNIAKSSHFSRKTADGGVNNMQELLQNDEDFKNGIVTAYVVMKTRAQQFNALVDMSVEVAGSIKDFEVVLADMKEVQPMVENVIASMEAAGKDIDSALGGGEVEDLEQNTSNAALAYNTLQKQNNLADKFIEIVDKCQKNGVIDDRVKFVRDQWVDYQQVTANLSQNKELAENLKKKGYLLSADKQVAALASFDKMNQVAELGGICLASMCNVEGAEKLFNNISSLDNNIEGALNLVTNLKLTDVQGAQNASEQGALNSQLKMQNNILLRAMDGLSNVQNSFQGAAKDISDNNILGNTGQLGIVINSLARPEATFR